MAKIVNPTNYSEKQLHLEEMIEAIDQSIINIDNVVKQQALLIQVIEKSEHSDEFVEFVKENLEQINNLRSQKDQLLVKKEKLLRINDLFKDVKKSEIVQLIFEAFGIFE